MQGITMCAHNFSFDLQVILIFWAKGYFCFHKNQQILTHDKQTPQNPWYKIYVMRGTQLGSVPMMFVIIQVYMSLIVNTTC